ncbi:insulinase family protein [Pedobacter frigoris]|uniref:Insulinase family protein n=1 Tax=Pedobacter frigoris TaxID=2571272 RepID=A0A4U1CH38_9SPHI|nr:insulinase family protein [Pedobacter frigoris]TKC05887.1 insulinase family protein [Pedobacter frigoris]
MKTLKTLKTFLIVGALIVTAKFGFAQSSALKNPVNFNLKNGINVIVAENQSTEKVFANLSFENEYSADKAAVQEVMNMMLNQQLSALDTGLSYSNKGVNLAVASKDFENVFAVLSAYIAAPEFTEVALNKAKSAVTAHLIANDKYFPDNVNKISVANLSLSDVKAYYSEVANPSTTVLTIAGNITPSVAKSYAKKSFVDFKAIDNQSKSYLVSNL